MAGTRTVAVVGATGAQGGGLVDAVLADPDAGYGVRALTRDPSSPAATVLAGRGAEVVQADLDDPTSLRNAFEGADAAYCLTNFWEHGSGAKELSQAGNLARATSEAGVEHVIWSSFSDTRRWLPLDDDRMPVLQEHFNIPHFDAKGEANALFDAERTTMLLTSFYWDNLIHFGMGPQPDEDGTLTITFPLGDAAMPGIAAMDIGRCAWGIVRAGDRFRGRTVGVMGESLTGAAMAAALGRALDRTVRYQDVPADTFRSFGFPGADEMGNMFQFKRDFAEVYTSERDVSLSRELNPDLQDFAAWLSRHAAEIPLGA